MEGTLNDQHINYNGSAYNVMVKWEDGHVLSKPLELVAADDPVLCALYAKQNNLLHLDGWKRFKKIADREKKLLRMVKQACLLSVCRSFSLSVWFSTP